MIDRLTTSMIGLCFVSGNILVRVALSLPASPLLYAYV